MAQIRAPGLRELQALARLLAVKLGVRDFGNDIRDARTEPPAQPVVARLGVLNRVVQQRGGQDHRIAHISFVAKCLREGERMVDVRRRIDVLAPLVAVFVGGEGVSLELEEPGLLQSSRPD